MLVLSMKSMTPIASAGLALALLTPAAGQIWRSQEWSGYAGNAQHTAISQSLSASAMTKILWSTPVDLNPQYSGSELLIHYAPPLVTYSGQVMVTVKTSAGGDFQVEARNCLTGGLLFTQPTDYVLPPHGWTPTCTSSLNGLYGMVTPGIGGTIYYRNRTDLPTSDPRVTIQQWAFYGLDSYNANKATYNSNLYICTPLTVDNAGNTYFGFRTTGSTPTNVVSGVAKVTPAGVGSWVSATAACADASITTPQMNCAPALSNDQRTLYVGVNSGGWTAGYLVGIDTATMQPKYSARCMDPRTGQPGALLDDSTATPMVGPDGDVYFGIFETGYYNDHGWLLHFDATLTQTKIPGAFGWDDTPSVVPSQCVPTYTGKSTYLLLAKYNNYVGLGPMGDGTNRVAILDPNGSSPAPQNGPSATTGLPVNTMTPIISVLGPTPDQGANLTTYPNAVHEWCINSAAIDVRGRCAILNSEDGNCYRWDFLTNKLSQTLSLSGGLGEAYTSTVIGRFGVSFAVNNARLCAVGKP